MGGDGIEGGDKDGERQRARKMDKESRWKKIKILTTVILLLILLISFGLKKKGKVCEQVCE